MKRLLLFLFIVTFSSYAHAGVVEIKQAGTSKGFVARLDFVSGATVTRTGIEGDITISGAVATAAGSVTEVQYNVDSLLSSDPGFVYRTSTRTLSVDGNINVDVSVTVGGNVIIGKLMSSDSGNVSGRLDVDGALSSDTMTVLSTLIIPNGLSPDTSTAGEIKYDTDSRAIEVFGGLKSRLLLLSQDVDFNIFAPDNVNDEVMIFRVDENMYPHGIRIVHVQFNMPSAAAYKLDIEKWVGDDDVDSPATFKGTIASLETSSVQVRKESGDTGARPITNTDLSPDSSIVLDIPATDVDWIHGKIIFFVMDSAIDD